MSTYREDLLADLRNPAYAAEYLTAAKQESRGAFLLAVRDVAEAQKGMAGVAAEAGVNRENLYRMLSEEGNPRLTSLDAVLDTLGIEVHFAPRGSSTGGILGAAMLEPESIVQPRSALEESVACDFQATTIHGGVWQQYDPQPLMVPWIAMINPAEGANSWPMKATNLSLSQMSISGHNNSLQLMPITLGSNPTYGTSESSSLRF
jgi:probable addiction module antidote protein